MARPSSKQEVARDALFLQGSEALEAGDLARAVAVFDRAIRADPSDSRAWRGKGVAAWRGDDLTGAEAAFRRSVELTPENGKGWLGLAQILEDQTRYEESVLEAERAIDLLHDPDLQERCLLTLGHGRMQLDDTPGARLACLQAARLRSGFAGPWLLLAHVYFRARRYPKAQRAAGRAVKMKADELSGWQILAGSADRRRMRNEAIAGYSSALALGDAGSAGRLAYLLTQQEGRSTEWERVLREGLALSVEPTQRASILHHLGFGFMKQGRIPESIDALAESVALAPADGIARHTLGQACAQAGDWRAAFAHMQEAATLIPDEPRIWDNLRNVADYLGHPDLARRYARKYILLTARRRPPPQSKRQPPSDDPPASAIPSGPAPGPVQVGKSRSLEV